MLLRHGSEPEFLPSITTASDGPVQDWRTAILELPRYRIRRCALFLTGLDHEGRVECYRRLKECRHFFPFTIPFVHARDDMAEEEYLFLRCEFGTDSFNLHPLRQRPLRHHLPPDVLLDIYIENITRKFGGVGLVESDLIGFGGLCLDLSHLEDQRLEDPAGYVALLGLAAGREIGANHVSAQREDGGGSTHTFTSLSQFDYLRNFTPDLLGRYVAMELGNPLNEQLRAIAYILPLFGL